MTDALPGSTSDPLADLHAAADHMSHRGLRARNQQVSRYWGLQASMIRGMAGKVSRSNGTAGWNDTGRAEFNDMVSLARNYLDAGGKV